LRTSPFLTLARAPSDTSALWVFRVRDTPAAAPTGPSPTSPVGLLWEAESLAHDTGEIVEDQTASNGRVVQATAGRDQPGFLLFGPYRLLPPGAYRATYRLRGAGTRLALQVTAAGGREVLGAAEARLDSDTGLRDVEVPFVVDRVLPVEYRVR